MPESPAPVPVPGPAAGDGAPTTPVVAATHPATTQLPVAAIAEPSAWAFTEAPAARMTEVLQTAIPQTADPADVGWSWYPGESTVVDMDVAGTLDPLFNSRFLRQMARRGALYATVAAFINFVVFLLDLLISLMHGAFGLLGFVPVFAVLSLIAVILLFILLPVPALLGEWHRLLTFRAPAAVPTLSFIQQALNRHHIPCDSLSPKPITPPGEGRKMYLELRRGFFAGYISSFAHGDDLYIGWTFWIYVSPLRALIMRLGRKVQDYTGRGNDIYQTLRFESTQATIAAMHACTLEGIKFAMGGSDRSPPAAAAPPSPSPAPPATASASASEAAQQVQPATSQVPSVS